MLFTPKQFGGQIGPLGYFPQRVLIMSSEFDFEISRGVFIRPQILKTFSYLKNLALFKSPDFLLCLRADVDLVPEIILINRGEILLRVLD